MKLKEKLYQLALGLLRRVLAKIRPVLPEFEKFSTGIKELPELIKQNAGESLGIGRGLSYGAAVVCLVILLSMVPIDHKDTALSFAILFSTFSLPCWVGLGLVYEQYIFVGKKVHQHFNSAFASKILKRLSFCAALSEYCAVCCVLWHLMPLALLIFVFSSFLATWYSIEIFVSMAHWWGETNHPELKTPARDNGPLP